MRMGDSQDYAVTMFVNHTATTQRLDRVNLDELCHRIAETTASSKKALPWLKLAIFGDARTNKGCLRHDANILKVSGSEADYDGGTYSFDDARDTLASAGVLAILYTSPSHTEDAPRWRVLCPFSTELPPAERNRMMDRLNGLFGGAFAGESWTLSQSYYYGSVNRNPSHRVERIDGTPIDLLPGLDAGAIGRPFLPPSVRPIEGHQADVPAQVSYERYNRFVATVLTTLRRDAVEGQKHYALVRIAKVLGGIQAAAGFTDADAIQWMMDQLPDAVADWSHAARTAAAGLANGRAKPISLPDRALRQNRAPPSEPERRCGDRADAGWPRQR